MPKAGYTTRRHHKTTYHGCCFNSVKRIFHSLMQFPDAITVSPFVIPSVPPPWPCLNGSFFNIVRGFLVLQKHAPPTHTHPVVAAIHEQLFPGMWNSRRHAWTSIFYGTALCYPEQQSQPNHFTPAM